MVRINRVYTRTGDQGETSLAGKHRLPKDHPRIEAYGTVDELNALLGMALAWLPEETPLQPIRKTLRRVQNELFDLGAELAVLPQDRRPSTPRIRPAQVEQLEKEMDQLNETLPPLTSFILPGGGKAAAWLHLARTVCRRAERRLVHLLRQEPFPTEGIKYLNRLSDYLFVAARYVARTAGEEETLWEPGTPTTEG